MTPQQEREASRTDGVTRSKKWSMGGERFGDEHGKKLTEATIGLAATVAGNEYKKSRG
jgi:hypothetical protein